MLPLSTIKFRNCPDFVFRSIDTFIVLNITGRKTTNMYSYSSNSLQPKAQRGKWRQKDIDWRLGIVTVMLDF